jgi:hypothetical protein
MTRETTILGVTYPGIPMMGSLAFSIWKLEQDGKPTEAQRLLDAHNKLNAVFGPTPADRAPLDLAADMTTLPMEGLLICRAR